MSYPAQLWNKLRHKMACQPLKNCCTYSQYAPVKWTNWDNPMPPSQKYSKGFRPTLVGKGSQVPQLENNWSQWDIVHSVWMSHHMPVETWKGWTRCEKLGENLYTVPQLWTWPGGTCLQTHVECTCDACVCGLNQSIKHHSTSKYLLNTAEPCCVLLFLLCLQHWPPVPTTDTWSWGSDKIHKHPVLPAHPTRATTCHAHLSIQSSKVLHNRHKLWCQHEPSGNCSWCQLNYLPTHSFLRPPTTFTLPPNQSQPIFTIDTQCTLYSPPGLHTCGWNSVSRPTLISLIHTEETPFEDFSPTHSAWSCLKTAVFSQVQNPRSSSAGWFWGELII